MGQYDNKTYETDFYSESADEDAALLDKKDVGFDKPYRELFLWAVLLNR